MTEEQMAAIVAIGDSLRAKPVSWDEIPEQQKQIVIDIMRPRPTFSDAQKSFIRRWWMRVDDARLASINAALPANTIVSPRVDVDGNKWISVDLFTDAVEPGMRLHRALDQLLGLELHYLEDNAWPVPDDTI